MTRLKRVSGPRCATRNIVQVEDSFYIERDMSAALNKCKISPRVVNLRQVDKSAIFDTHLNRPRVLTLQIKIVKLIRHAAASELCLELMDTTAQVLSIISVARAEIKIPAPFGLRLFDRMLEYRV